MKIEHCPTLSKSCKPLQHTLKERRQPPETQYFDLYHPMAPLPRSDSAAYLPHIRTPLGVFALHSLYLYSNTPPPRQPFFRLAQAIFGPNLFSQKYPKNLIPVILPAYTAYEDETDREFRNVGI
jgi:hypothetical protein